MNKFRYAGQRVQDFTLHLTEILDLAGNLDLEKHNSWDAFYNSAKNHYSHQFLYVLKQNLLVCCSEYHDSAKI